MYDGPMRTFVMSTASKRSLELDRCRRTVVSIAASKREGGVRLSDADLYDECRVREFDIAGLMRT